MGLRGLIGFNTNRNPTSLPSPNNFFEYKNEKKNTNTPYESILVD